MSASVSPCVAVSSALISSIRDANSCLASLTWLSCVSLISEWFLIIVGFQCHSVRSVLPKFLAIGISGSQPNAICVHQFSYKLLSFDILQFLTFACPLITGLPHCIATMPGQDHFKVGTLSVRDLSAQCVDFGPLSFRCWHDALVLLVPTTRVRLVERTVDSA